MFLFYIIVYFRFLYQSSHISLKWAEIKYYYRFKNIFVCYILHSFTVHMVMVSFTVDKLKHNIY